MPGNQHDLLIYTFHRFALNAAGQRLVFDKKALTDTRLEARIDSFRTLIDLDDAGQKAIGLKVLGKLNLNRGGWMSRKSPSIGRLRPSMR